jgi:16S rRNA (guanine1207-N2)-methyltransferase
MSHYFENDESVKSCIKSIDIYFKDKYFRFASDNGVFSKDGVDVGSKLLVETYVAYGRKGRVLDVGSGIGVIGIMISKFNNCEVDMLEINKRAVSLCEKNIFDNELDKCRVFESDVYEKADGVYDAVVSNPPIRAGKSVVFEILEKAKEHLVDNGELWVVIRKKQGADSAKKKLMEVYGNCEVVNKDKGFCILKSVKF